MSPGPHRIGFVDHSFHRESRSTEFFIEILRRTATVDVFWDHSWEGGAGVTSDELNDVHYDALVFFQMLYPAEWLSQLSCRNITLVPMYDSAAGCSDEDWLAYGEFKVLNFSRELERRHARLGLSSLYCQYFGPSGTERVSFDGLRGLLWQRTDDVTWEHVKSLIDATRFDSFHLHLAADPPGYRVVEPSDDERRKFNVTISRWSESGAEYLAHRAKANVFFAPRKAEGIGQALLEAMSAGMLVVAPDGPTMNEYIVNERNGFLYDLQDPKPLPFDRAAVVGHQAWLASRDGVERWAKQAPEILAFVDEPRRRRDGSLSERLGIAGRRLHCRIRSLWQRHVWPVVNGFRRPRREIPLRAVRCIERAFGGKVESDRRAGGVEQGRPRERGADR